MALTVCAIDERPRMDTALAFRSLAIASPQPPSAFCWLKISRRIFAKSGEGRGLTGAAQSRHDVRKRGQRPAGPATPPRAVAIAHVRQVLDALCYGGGRFGGQFARERAAVHGIDEQADNTAGEVRALHVVDGGEGRVVRGREHIKPGNVRLFDEPQPPSGRW